MQIEASMEEPIQISANEEGYDGDLHIEVENSYEIERDYDQNLMLTVTNISDQARGHITWPSIIPMRICPSTLSKEALKANRC